MRGVPGEGVDGVSCGPPDLARAELADKLQHEALGQVSDEV